jgi:site-specific recombinase XerD
MAKRKGQMTDSEQAETYEQRVQGIRQANQPLLEGFEHWLRQSGLREPTIRDHVDNLRLFEHYLLLYDYSLRRLDDATDSEVYWFLADWFPPKALWASVSSMTVYLATFKKFFKWMGETGLVSSQVVADVRSTLKEERRVFLRAVEE